MSFFSELITSFSLGLLSTLNPCVLPLFPGFVTFLSSKQKSLSQKSFVRLAGVLVLVGVLVFMSVLGLVTASFGLSINRFVGVVSPIAFSVLVLLGFVLLFDLKVFSKLPRPRNRLSKNPFVSAFSFGLLYGPIVIPCNAPLVFAVFAYATSVFGFFNQFLNLVVFGLGLGFPLLIFSFLPLKTSQKVIGFFSKHHTMINRIAGLFLIFFGLYELIFVFKIF